MGLLHPCQGFSFQDQRPEHHSTYMYFHIIIHNTKNLCCCKTPGALKKHGGR